MKINLLSSADQRCIAITGQISERDKLWFREFSNHAWLKKTDVQFNPYEKVLSIKLRRHEENTKARKKFLKFVIWDNSIPPTQDCLLTIRDIEKCDIENQNPETQKINDVIIGGVLIKDDEIYIGSACRYDNDYSIILKFNKLNIRLEDM